MWNRRYNHHLAVGVYIDIKCTEVAFENCMSPTAGRRRYLLPHTDGEDAEQTNNDAENRHDTVAFAEADGGI